LVSYIFGALEFYAAYVIVLGIIIIYRYFHVFSIAELPADWLKAHFELFGNFKGFLKRLIDTLPSI